MSHVRRNARRFLAVSTAAATVASLLGPGAGRAVAATDTYNSTGTADGLWDTATNWVPVPAGAAHKPTALEDAIFVGPPPAAGRQITLGTGEVANSLRFSDEYVLTGGDLTLTTANITVDSGLNYPYAVGSPSSRGLVPAISFNSATITSSLIGSAGLTKLGGGTLFLSGINTFGGSGQSITISGGRLGIISDVALGNAANSITLDGGALWLDENVTFGRAINLTANGGTIDVSNGKTASYFGPGFVLGGGASTATVLTKTGLGTLDISSPNAFTGTIVLATNGGTLRLIGDTGTLAAPTAGSFSSAAGIVINPSSTLAIDNQNNFGPFTNFQSLPAAGNNDRLGNAPITLNGGSLTYTAANGTTAASIHELIGPVTLNAGASTLGVTAFTGTGTTSLGGELELGSLTRNLGTTVNFNINGTTPGAAGNNGRILIDSSTLSGTGGLIGGWATVNNVDFAGTTTFSLNVVSVGVVSGTGAYDSGNTAASFASGKNTNLGADLTLPAGTTTTGSCSRSASSGSATCSTPTLTPMIRAPTSSTGRSSMPVRSTTLPMPGATAPGSPPSSTAVDGRCGWAGSTSRACPMARRWRPGSASTRSMLRSSTVTSLRDVPARSG